jgi:antitoxin (DNA-binding transcriptional repressor) of toxin-antitoxin stability system
MESHLSATEAARTFSDILNRVRYRGETFVIERGGEPVCRMTPVAAPGRFTAKDLARLLETHPRPDALYLDAVEEAVASQSTLPGSAWER